ncbi:MAG: hypothetical protein LQ341_006114 [Variospora aurantia]|nr:MAG: hypothetical protein LQ341_006114 [Variospora aurantia]
MSPFHVFRNFISLGKTQDAATGSQPPKLPGLGELPEFPEKGDDGEARVDSDVDIRKKQSAVGDLVRLAYQSIGVIYGDIGTSPLYVYSSTFSSSPSRDDLLGALSLIIWSVTLMVSVKYVLIVLYADDEGEGGTFAIYSLLSRYAHIVRRDPREERSIKMERESNLPAMSKHTRSFLERSWVMKTFLKIIGVVGVSLVMSDGVLTPAQSVLGAIQGLRLVNESITTATIVGTSCAILILLFLIQPFGTSKIGSCFAPIVILWLSLNLSFGIYNLVWYDHSVLKAFSPAFAGQYLVRNKTDGWRSLGGILLAFTGVEALFADLGAFSRTAIQLSWLCFAFPCLLMAYIGQAAYISVHPEAYSNPFFNAVPPGTFYPSLVIAILAAIVASQTMITATFQLLSQIIKLSYFPQIKVVHTSKIFQNQIYIPWANWLLMIGTIVVTVAYNNTTRLGEAYGVCVILVTFITTIMIVLVAIIIWHMALPVVILAFLIFGALDGVYLSSALTKVPNGAWFTLLLAGVLSSIFVLWRFGKENQWQAEASDLIAPSSIIFSGADDGPPKANATAGGLHLTAMFGRTPISAITGFGIFFDKSGIKQTTPTVFVHFLQKFQAAPRVVVFFNLRPLPVPTLPFEERFTVTRPLQPSANGAGHLFFRITLRHGYTDEVVSADLGFQIYEQLRSFVIREGATAQYQRQKHIKWAIPDGQANSGETELAMPPKHLDEIAEVGDEAQPEASGGTPTVAQQEVTRRELSSLECAYQDQVVYVVGKEQMRIREVTGCKPRGWCRRIALAAFLWLRSNTGSKIANLNVDVDKLVEVGFVKII